MSVKFENYTHSFKLNGKPVFAPSELGRKIGDDIKQRVEATHSFPSYYFHLQRGGHVAAIHAHRANNYFCKIDLENFFYSIARNRVARSLRRIGVVRSAHYARWSTVKSPYEDPSYALPYGFVQSPILSTLVLEHSPVGSVLEQMPPDVTAAVYVDDISLSSNNIKILSASFSKLTEAVALAGLKINNSKSVAPCRDMLVFNCGLKFGETFVAPERVSTFFSVDRGPLSVAGFERYCDSVKKGNF